tara:strand:- start:4 stop:657 length:654 start_codon:yes stop_codon:yes gene_type:complete
MAMNGKRLGNLLLKADIITKRQLAQACQKQIKGDKRKLGEILVEMGYVTVEDLTEVMMEQASRATDEVEKGKRDRLLQKQISKSKSKPKSEPVAKKDADQPVELSEEKVMNTKFTMSVQTIVALATVIASAVGVYYMLLSEIEEAKELPSLETLYQSEYPSRPEGYNWPRSFEQYKENVEGLQDEMDDAYDVLEEMKEVIKELQKDIKDLERRKKDK